MTPTGPWHARRALAVLGTGSAVPGEPVATGALIERISTRFGFDRAAAALAIAARLGVASRHIARAFVEPIEIARPGMSNADLSAQAVRAALADAGAGIGDIGYLVAHTATPESQLPPNVALVADRLGYSGPYVEIRQACTGFANALMVANGLAGTLDGRVVVIVGSETGSLFLDPRRLADAPDQIVNLVQMGDGAGAVVLDVAASSRATLETSWFGAIGAGRAPGISMPAGARQFAHDFAAIERTGGALFGAGIQALAMAGHAPDTVDLVVPHQASGRIGARLAAHLAIPAARFFVNANRLGNTGSAAMWIALAEARAAGLRSGATIAALGAEASKYMYGGFVYAHR